MDVTVAAHFLVCHKQFHQKYNPMPQITEQPQPKKVKVRIIFPADSPITFHETVREEELSLEDLGLYRKMGFGVAIL